jgi:hypothetical protein
MIARLVLGWVTTGESLVSYVHHRRSHSSVGQSVVLIVTLPREDDHQVVVIPQCEGREFKPLWDHSFAMGREGVVYLSSLGSAFCSVMNALCPIDLD